MAATDKVSGASMYSIKSNYTFSSNTENSIFNTFFFEFYFPIVHQFPHIKNIRKIWSPFCWWIACIRRKNASILISVYFGAKFSNFPTFPELENSIFSSFSPKINVALVGCCQHQIHNSFKHGFLYHIGRRSRKNNSWLKSVWWHIHTIMFFLFQRIPFLHGVVGTWKLKLNCCKNRMKIYQILICEPIKSKKYVWA